MKPIKNKVVLIGAGMVGSAIINSLLNLELIGEIVIIDNNQERAKGEALDASHTTSFAYSPNVLVREGNYEDCADSQIIVISAGQNAKPGGSLSRLDLAGANVTIMNSIMTSICKHTKEAIIIVVTNPVDILTYFLQNNFDYPKEKIIGTGTILDTARFVRILGKKYLVDTKNIQGFVLGEHGESAFAAWSLVSIAGIPVSSLDEIMGSEEPLDYEGTISEVKSVGTEILISKGYTNAGIAMSVSVLVKAILLNELSIFPVSTTLEGQYGIKDVALSIPCIISSEGISKKLAVPLTEDEIKLLKKSANHLAENLKKLNLSNGER